MDVEVTSPHKCSLIEHPEATIQFFRKAEKAFMENNNVIFNLTDCTYFSETSTALLAAFMKDKNLNRGKASKVKFPKDSECKKSLHDRGFNKRYNTEGNEISVCDSPVHKVSNLKVANDIAKEIIKASSLFIYGEHRMIKELYSILIELMANTNNHADSKKRAVYPWWLTFYPDFSNRTIKFVFIDLGVGIFNSIPVTQYINKSPQQLYTLST